MAPQIAKAAAPTVVEDDPKYPYKAYVSAALSAVVTFIALYLSDKGGKGGFTHDELLADLGAALLAAIGLGGGTFLTPNPKRLKRLKVRRNEGGWTTGQVMLLLVMAFIVVILLVAILPALHRG